MATNPYVRAPRIADTAPRLPSGRAARTALAALTALAGCWLMLAVIAVPSAHAERFQKGFWGPTEIDGKSQFPIYRDLRVTLFQMSISWATVAPTRPRHARDPRDRAYIWPPEIDDAIRQAKRYHMRVLLMLTNAPSWANSGRTPEYAPDRPSDFAAFARAAARRYPAVRHWMIWGEPSRSPNFKPFVQQELGTKITAAQKRAPRRYARILDAAYGQLKAQRKSNIIIGGNTYVTGEVRPGDWMRAMKLPDGRPPRLTYYGHNPFSFRKPSLYRGPSDQGLVDFSDLGRFDKEIQRALGRPRKKTIKLFLSEFTMPTAVDREFNFHTSQKGQAIWITNAFKIVRKVKNIAGLGWIHLRDQPPDGDTLVSHGGLMTHTGKKKLGYYAFKRGHGRSVTKPKARATRSAR